MRMDLSFIKMYNFKDIVKSILVILLLATPVITYSTAASPYKYVYPPTSIYLQPPPQPLRNIDYRTLPTKATQQQLQQQQQQPQQQQLQPLTFMQKFVRWFGFGGVPIVSSSNNYLNATQPQHYNTNSNYNQQQQYRNNNNNNYNNNNYNNNINNHNRQPEKITNPPQPPTTKRQIPQYQQIQQNSEQTFTPCNHIPWIPIYPFIQRTPVLKGNGEKSNIYPRNPQTEILTFSNDYFPRDVETFPPITSTTAAPPEKYMTQSNDYLNRNELNVLALPSTPAPFQVSEPTPFARLEQPTNQPSANIQPSYQSIIQPAINVYSSYQTLNQPYPQINSNFLQINAITTRRPMKTMPTSMLQISVTSPEYIPPSQSLPIENAYRPFAPIPVPNLSATPIPPLHNAQPFLINSYGSEVKYNNHNQQLQTGLMDSVPKHIYTQLDLSSDTDIEVIKSVPVAQFSTSSIQHSAIPEPYGQNLNNIKNDIRTLNNLINEPIIVNTGDLTTDSYPSASTNQNFTVTENDENLFKTQDTTFYTQPTTESTLNFATDTVVKTLQQKLIQNQNVPEQSLLEAAGTTKSFRLSKQSLDSIQNYEKNKLAQLNYSKFGTSLAPGFSTNEEITTLTPPAEWLTTKNWLYTTAKDNKKSKQIQIIIPYKLSNPPSPFMASNNKSNELFSNWTKSYRNLDVYDQHGIQESKIVTATSEPILSSTPHPPKKYITRVLASNLRDLLKNEKDIRIKEKPKQQQQSFSSFDLEKLQMNIDEWTVQEFASSDMENKASTISLAAPSKNIPAEYLTTTPIPPTTILPSTTEEYYYPTTVIFPDKTVVRQKSSRYDDNLWNELGVTISPITHEKVYVVTPQTIDVEKSTPPSIKDDQAFKSPRFIIRPAPGVSQNVVNLNEIKSTLAYSVNGLISTAQTTPVPKTFKPKLFGYMNYISPFSQLMENEDSKKDKAIRIVRPLSFIRNNDLLDKNKTNST